MSGNPRINLRSHGPTECSAARAVKAPGLDGSDADRVVAMRAMIARGPKIEYRFYINATHATTAAVPIYWLPA